MGRKNNLLGGSGVRVGTHVQHPDGRQGRVTHSGPDDVAVNWNDGRQGKYPHNGLVVIRKSIKRKRYPESRTKKIAEDATVHPNYVKQFGAGDRVRNKLTGKEGDIDSIGKRDGIYYYLVMYDNGDSSAHKYHVLERAPRRLREAPGEFGAAISRFGQRLKNSAIKGADGKLRALNAATMLSQDWVRFSKEQGLPDNLMNMLTFLRSQHGWEPTKGTYDQIAHYMKTGKIISTKPSPNDDKPAEQPAQQAQAQAQAQPQQAQPQQPQAQAQQPGATQQSTGSSARAPEPKVDTQPQPMQPGAAPAEGSSEPEVGDWVQATINGEDQFEKPRKITRKLQNGWYQVHGSNTGIQSHQMRVVQKGGDEYVPPKAAKPRIKVQAGSSKNESYADLVIKSILKEDYGLPNANKQLNRKQIDSLMLIVARDMLRRGLIDMNGHDDDKQQTTKPSHQNGQNPQKPLPKGYEHGPNGPVIAVNSPKFNELLDQMGVAPAELARIQELGRRYANNPEGMARSLRDANDVELSKKVMTAAMMSLGAQIKAAQPQQQQQQQQQPPPQQ